MKYFRYACAVITVIILSCALTGCAGRYNESGTVTARSKYPNALAQAKKHKWQVMLHSGVNLYSVTSFEMDKAKQQLTVHLDRIDSANLINANNPETMRLKPAGNETALRPNMHMHMSDSTSYTLDEPHTILLDKVARIQLVK